HARLSGATAQRELGKLAVVAARQAMANVANRAGDHRVVVEQPVGARRNEFALLGGPQEGAVGFAERLGVSIQPPECVTATSAGPRIDREPGRQRPGLFLQPLHAEELGGDRPLAPSPALRREETRQDFGEDSDGMASEGIHRRTATAGAPSGRDGPYSLEIGAARRPTKARSRRAIANT